MDYVDPFDDSHHYYDPEQEENNRHGWQQGYSSTGVGRDAGQDDPDLEAGEEDDREFENNNNWDTDEEDTEGETPRGAPSLDEDIKAIYADLGDSPPKYDKLIEILLNRDAGHIEKIRMEYKSLSNSNSDLIKAISKSPTVVGGQKSDAPINTALKALVYGPSLSDAYWVHTAVNGVGTFESLLDQAVLGKEPRDAHDLSNRYCGVFSKEMIKDIKGDLSDDEKAFYKALFKEAEAVHDGKRLDPEITKLAREISSKIKNSKQRDTIIQIIARVAPSDLPELNKLLSKNHNYELREKMEGLFKDHLQKALLWRFDTAVKAREAGQTIPESTLYQHLEENRSRSFLDLKRNEWDLVLVSNLLRIHWAGDMQRVREGYKASVKRELADDVKKKIKAANTPFLKFCLKLIQFKPRM